MERFPHKHVFFAVSTFLRYTADKWIEVAIAKWSLTFLIEPLEEFSGVKIAYWVSANNKSEPAMFRTKPPLYLSKWRCTHRQQTHVCADSANR